MESDPSTGATGIESTGAAGIVDKVGAIGTLSVGALGMLVVIPGIDSDGATGIFESNDSPS